MCEVCDSDHTPDKLLLCDYCDKGYHTFCLKPRLLVIPPGAWFCPGCTPQLQPIFSPVAVDDDQTHGHRSTDHNSECPICDLADTRRTIQCRSCLHRFHAQCLGLHGTAYPAGEFLCASCNLFANRIPSPTCEALNAAHMLVYLTGHRVACSSMDTYASAMHRFVHFCTTCLGKPISEVLPPGVHGVIDCELVKLFIAHAASRYKISTVRVTLSALVDWHKSKGAVSTSVSPSNPQIKQLLQAVKQQQGPEGLPKGKVGMSKQVLFLLLRHILQLQTSDLQMSELYIRDWAIFALGFYGFLRRSELIALNVGDVSFVEGSSPYIDLRIRKSKTDQAGAGASVIITQCTKDGLRIGEGLHRLIALRVQSGAGPDDPLVPAWDLNAMKLHRSTRLKNGQALASRLKLYLTAILRQFPNVQVNPATYGMHSLRRGGVVAAWAEGVDVDRIKAHGRWKSSAVQVYLTPDLSIRLSVTALM